MSVAKRYKTINLNGSQCFALLRSVASRDTWLTAQIELAQRMEETGEHLAYLLQQREEVLALRQLFNDTPFVEG